MRGKMLFAPLLLACIAVPPGGPAPAMGAGPFDGHYVGVGMAPDAPGCARQQDYDFAVANNEVTGTVVSSTRQGAGRRGGTFGGAISDLSGHVDLSGAATLLLTPRGQAGAKGTVTGRFANGRFTGRRGEPCPREITASRQ